MKRYDFFIAYAGPDRRQAKRLAWFLEDEVCEVFLDVHGLEPGGSWPVALREALRASRAILILISANSDDSFFQQEELVRAIALARETPDQKTVIPILLENMASLPSGMPYGTGILQAKDATRGGGLERVSFELADWFAELKAPQELQSPLAGVSYQALGAALRLDRFPQWSGVVEESTRPGHVFFLLHGPRDQSVGLFVERIQRYLSQEILDPHVVYRVRFKWEGVTARCGADWLRHLRLALGGEGSASQCLSRAAQEQALFLVFGLSPLARLDTQEQEGIRELVETLPGLLRDARPKYPIRSLLALDYAEEPVDGSQPSLVRLVDRWNRKTLTTGEIRYKMLPPVRLPEWHEVKAYLDERESEPSTEMVTELKKDYSRLRGERRLSYHELADMLDRYLQDA